MKKQDYMNTVWTFLGIYGVWFAVLSGLQELSQGIYWKVLASLLLAYAVYKWTESTR